MEMGAGGAQSSDAAAKAEGKSWMGANGDEKGKPTGKHTDQ